MADSDQRRRDLIGRKLADRYRILDIISVGGMGTVYLAQHLRLGRKVALKRLRPDLARNTRAIVRFQREARAAASTLHDHIVDVFDLGYDEEGAPFLVMERLRGSTLGEVIENEGPLHGMRVCRIMAQLLDALAAVHRKGIVHRDLKPENVFLTERFGRGDFVKVVDFGVSKIYDQSEEDFEVTRSGMVVGTPYYMSPEQITGFAAVDQRVDIYAAGVLMYECLTGQVPFEASSYPKLVQRILAGVHTPVEELRPDVPAELGEITRRAMALNVDDRYEDAATMFRAVAMMISGSPGSTLYSLFPSEPPPARDDERREKH